MKLPKLVIFDMAGTTVADRGEVPAAFAAALDRHGIQVSDEQIRAVRGASKRQAVFELVPDGPERAAQAERIYLSFKADLARRFAAGVRPLPGAVETFEWLRTRGALVALNTGFDRDIVEQLLAALHWNRSDFAAIVCGDDVSQGRPAPQLIFGCMQVASIHSASEVAVVGDTLLDLQAGCAAGAAWNIGVLSGAHSREQLVQGPHTHLVPSVAELPLLWRDIC